MEILEQLLNDLEQYVAGAKKSVFSSGDAVINRARLLDLADRIRRALPGELAEARAIVEDCDNQKQTTMRYCADMIGEAEKRREAMLDETDVLKQANEEAEAVRKEMEALRSRVEYEVKCKVDEVLRDCEVTLRDAITLIRNNRGELRNTLQDAPQTPPEEERER